MCDKPVKSAKESRKLKRILHRVASGAKLKENIFFELERKCLNIFLISSYIADFVEPEIMSICPRLTCVQNCLTLQPASPK